MTASNQAAGLLWKPLRRETQAGLSRREREGQGSGHSVCPARVPGEAAWGHVPAGELRRSWAAEALLGALLRAEHRGCVLLWIAAGRCG